MKKISILILFIILLIGSISCVNAEDNQTIDNSINDTVTEDVSSSNSDDNSIGNAIWVRAGDMEKVNFQTLKNSNIDTVLLSYGAINTFGRSSVVSWVDSANSNGINVHIWMQVCYHGGFENPLKNGAINTALLERDLTDAYNFATIPGIKGVHLDYVRYPGTAYKNPGGTNAVTYFASSIVDTVKSVNSSLILSAAIMPEPNVAIYYYGQNLSALSSMFDYIMPMVYKGNYKQDTAWIESTTDYYVTHSLRAKVITGLQSYVSDNNIAKLSSSELKRDVDASYNGGAYGVALFRYGLTNYVDFGTLHEVDTSVRVGTVLNVNNYNRKASEGGNVTGILSDTNGNPIAGQHVSLKLTRLASGASKVYDVVTDYSGSFLLPINLGSGKYSVTASYNRLRLSDVTYKKASPVTASLIVERDDLISVNLTTVSYNESVETGGNFTGFLFENGTVPLAGHTVGVTLKRASNNQNKTYYSVTDYNGMFTLSINLAVGDYLAYCSFDGADKYQSVSSSNTITVYS